MPHRQRPATEEEEIGRDLPKPQIASSSIVGRTIGGLQSALSTITQAPGIRQTLSGLETVASTAGGLGSAEIRAHKGVIQESGWGGWAQDMMNPFDQSLVRAKFDEVIGLDEQRGFMTTLRTAADWQRNRESAFWGEKFLSEVLFDPLTWLPLGAITKGIGRLGRIARRTPEQIKEMQERPLANMGTPTVVKDPGDIDDLTDPLAKWRKIQGYDDNSLRSLASTVYKFIGKIPSYKNFPANLLRAPLLMNNPSGLLKLGTKVVGEQVQIRGLERQRKVLRDEGVIFGDLAYPRLLEETRPFDTAMRNIEGVDQQVVKNVTRKNVSDTSPVIFEDVMEFPERYNLNELQTELVGASRHVLDEYYKYLTKWGEIMKFDVSPSELVPNQRYWPRIRAMLNEFESYQKTGRLRSGQTPSIVQKRFFDTFEDSTLSGHRFAQSTDRPVTDILYQYMKIVAKTVTDQGYYDDVMRLTGKNVLEKRKLVDKAPGSLNFKIANLTQQQVILRRAIAAINDWQVNGTPPGVAIYDELDSLTPDLQVISQELKQLINPYIKDGAGLRLYEADPTRLAKDMMSRRARRDDPEYSRLLLQRYQTLLNPLRTLQKQVDIDLRVVQRDRDSLAKIVRAEQKQGTVPFPKTGGLDPEFNQYLFDPDDIASVMPQLSTRDELIRQNRLLRMVPGGTAAVSGAIGTAAAVGSTARAFQLTYDIGVQFLQGAIVAFASPKVWYTSTRKMLNTWNNPSKLLEYIKDPKTREVLDLFEGRIQIVSNEFTEAFQRGTALNTALGKVPVVGRLTEKFRTSFDAFGDVARIEMAKAYMPALKKALREGKGVTTDQVANHVNKMTGISSSRALGIGAVQRDLEGAMISLAPNYLRATTGLLADAVQTLIPNVTRGGRYFGWDVQQRFESKQALYALTKFFGGTVALYVGICEALDQPIRLNPRSIKEGGDGGAFMTVVIDGQRVGLGTKPYAIMRRVAAMTLAMDKGNYTEALIEGKNFFRGQTAPLSSSMWDILRGETAIGEPVQTAGEIFGVGVTARLLPFWAEAAINDDPKPSGFGTAADFVGLRSGPLSYGAMRFEVREELASRFPKNLLRPDQIKFMENEFMEEPTWDMLSKIQKSKLERGEIPGLHPAKLQELRRFNEVITERNKRIGPPKTRAYLQDLADARTRLEIETEKLQILYEQDEITPYRVRKLTSYINQIYGQDMEKIHAEDGPHEEYFQDLDNEREKRQQRGEYEPLEDRAYQEYIDLIVAADDLNHYKGADGYDYLERDRREQRLRQIYGNTIINDIQREFRENKKVGLLYKQHQIDRIDLEPYWEIQNAYVDRNPILRSLLEDIRRAESIGNLALVDQLKSMPRYKAMNRQTRAAKVQLRTLMPRLDALLRFWGYTTTLQTGMAELLYYQIVADAKAGKLRE